MDVSAATVPPEAVPDDPEAMLEAFDCLGCHSLEPGGVLVGPPFEASPLRGWWPPSMVRRAALAR